MSEIFGKRKAALIDMDGVLYDSMPGHTLAWKRMMEGLGVKCTREEFYLYEGMTGTATINLLMRRAFGKEVSAVRARELYEIKSRYFKEAGPAPMMPGADRMLSALKRGGLQRVLVTGSGQKSLLEAIDRDYPGMFDSGKRVTALDVTHGKPNPEPYLRGAAKAGVDARDAIVIENAPLGVRAGKAAGAFTIAVTTGPIPREEFEKEGADMIFPSMPAFADFLERELNESRRNRGVEKSETGRVVYTDTLRETLTECVERLSPDQVFVLTDRNVEPVMRGLGLEIGDGMHLYELEPGEGSKTLASAEGIWEWLVRFGATRRSVLVNIGGGVVTDLGGFAASVFKRGIRFINVPTTLLGAVDAAIGGKTGVDFCGLKNEIGAFAEAEKVIVSESVLETLPKREMLSGFGEVVKMAMLTDEEIYRSLLEGDAMADRSLMARAMHNAASAKEEIVSVDPREKGLRRILNFGHTAGHAFEMLAARRGREMTHGEGVAHGILVALMLGEKRQGFPTEETAAYRERILERYYGALPFVKEDISDLVELMKHDKKNLRKGEISFVLLGSVGNPVESVTVEESELTEILVGMLQK